MKLSGEVKIQWSDEDGKSSIYHTYTMNNLKERAGESPKTHS